ncbi:hypothetical protein KPH14_010754 [Odynerus spinipes]|uniref:Enoyl-CoA delta isomerase 1, mitochondrial n=1 Tax=Odynerus spinipes TaxID=1348599 RepID=A0AAD9VUE5_9HYME|nr:hypothetical protein KPH14_010754 [Odynerus spinipes]
MLLLRRFLTKQQSHLIRNYASGKKFVEVTQDEKTGIHVVSMAKPPVNSLNLELLEDLKTSLEEAQKDKCKGIILSSSLPTIFSAGLDIMEMYKPDVNRFTTFWRTLQDTWMTLYGLEVPIAAAINGASPAGGCLLAISSEYRVLVDGKHTIGLNETQLGIVAPKWFIDPYIDTIGKRQAELALLRGTLFRPNEALHIGLVDELAVNKEEAIKKCQNYIYSYNKTPQLARKLTKLQLRMETISWLQQNREAELSKTLKFVTSPSVQNNLHTYIEALKQKQS